MCIHSMSHCIFLVRGFFLPRWEASVKLTDASYNCIARFCADLLVVAMHHVYCHLADCKQRVTQYVVPFVTHIRTKETKPVVVGQVQGYLISSFIFCDTEVTLPYWFLGYHSLIPIYQKGFREQLVLQM